MNTRLQQFLAAENINQAQFADSIGVARASVSHILAGRNKPGYEFILNMMRRYPELNIEWLLTGSGRMYKSNSEAQGETVRPGQTLDLFDSFPLMAASEEPSITPQESNISPVSVTPQANTQTSESSRAEVNRPQPIVNQRKAVKIMIFYDDSTFEEFEK